MAQPASHDIAGDRGYAALNRFRVGHWNFLWVYPAVSAEDVIVDRGGVDFSLQQDRGRDCGDAARRNDLGDARPLRCRIPIRVLDPESPTCPARPFSAISAP